MPNCDFYALASDLVEVLDFVFAQPGWTLIELASQHEKSLRQFHSVAQLKGAFPTFSRLSRALHFQLYSAEMGGHWKARRINFNPSVGARFRYDCEGLGLIQLYFGAIRNEQLSSCHTNHFSAKRAKSWEDIVAERGSADAWDFNAVNRMSSRLNRFIRGRGVAKWGSRAILPAAQMAFASGKLARGM